MRKIPTLFLRDAKDPRRVTETINPLCAWVTNGEGVATRKLDGTCCLVRNGQLFKRREVKPGAEEPEGFKLEERDPLTGKLVGWVPVQPKDRGDRWHWGALIAFKRVPPDGTYELVGPKVQGNAEGRDSHTLEPHGAIELDFRWESREHLIAWLTENPVEGIVWHGPDGAMAKIKRRDFGLPWPVRKREA